MKSKISVLMPVYNSSNFVAKSIESILNQSFGNFELVIIDGGSTDNTLKIVYSFEDRRIRVVESKKRIPLIESLNHGIQISNGEFIARQDADDISNPQRLEKQYSTFCHDKNLAVLGSSYALIDENGTITSRQFMKKQIDCKDLEEHNQLCHGSVMFRKDVVLKEGLYDVLFPTCEDYELWCRIINKGYKIANLEECLYLLRIHDSSVSAKKWKTQILYTFIVREIYFGTLKKEDIKVSMFPVGGSKQLYSMLSLPVKKAYHRDLAQRYIQLNQYTNALLELAKLIRLDPKEAKRVNLRKLKIFAHVM